MDAGMALPAQRHQIFRHMRPAVAPVVQPVVELEAILAARTTGLALPVVAIEDLAPHPIGNTGRCLVVDVRR